MNDLAPIFPPGSPSSPTPPPVASPPSTRSPVAKLANPADPASSPRPPRQTRSRRSTDHAAVDRVGPAISILLALALIAELLARSIGHPAAVAALLLPVAALGWLGGAAIGGFIGISVGSCAAAWLLVGSDRSPADLPWPLFLALPLVGAAVGSLAERERAKARRFARLWRLAHYDHLTGLANRALLLQRCADALAQSRHAGADVALVFVDLDAFKGINDRHGHAAGDHLLQLVGDRLRHATRDGDTVARLGGDEFAVLLPDVRLAADAQRVARRIAAHLAAPVVLGDHRLTITASIGLAHAADHAPLGSPPSVDALLQTADAAMYDAKRARRTTPPDAPPAPVLHTLLAAPMPPRRAGSATVPPPRPPTHHTVGPAPFAAASVLTPGHRTAASTSIALPSPLPTFPTLHRSNANTAPPPPTLTPR